jgi:hypothetical protein
MSRMTKSSELQSCNEMLVSTWWETEYRLDVHRAHKVYVLGSEHIRNFVMFSFFKKYLFLQHTLRLKIYNALYFRHLISDTLYINALFA